MKKTTKVDKVVSIVNVGAIANSETGEGRLIPVVVIDCSDHRELLNLIYAHTSILSGDADSTWGYESYRKDTVYLILEFTHPAEVTAVIEFKGASRLIVADGAMRAKAIYLQPSDSGKSVTEGLEKPKILVEVAGSQPPKWESKLLRDIAKKLRSDGLTRREAKTAAPQHLARMRELWKIRPQ